MYKKLFYEYSIAYIALILAPLNEVNSSGGCRRSRPRAAAAAPRGAGPPPAGGAGNRLRAAPRQRRETDAPVRGGAERLSSWFECGQIFLCE